MKDYNSVARLLLEAFDEAEISQRDGADNKSFSFVPPERYRYRLLRVFPNGYKFHVDQIAESKLGVRGQATFVGDVPEEGVRYDISVPAAEPWTFKKGTTDILNYDQAYAKLTSAGLKAIAREMGLGLHLYDKAANRSTGGTKSSGNANSAGTHDSEWTGDEKVNIGKFKNTDTRWNDEDAVDGGYLDYVTSGDKPNQKALKEIARRLKASGDGGQRKAESSANAHEDSDFPFN